MRGDVDPEERPTIGIVDVVVADARSHAPILHAPALPDDVLAGVGAEMVVDVEDAGLFRRLLAIVVEVAAEHPEVEHDRAEISREVVHHRPDRVGRRHHRRLKKKACRRRRDAAHAFERRLSDRERRDRCVEGDASALRVPRSTAMSRATS